MTVREEFEAELRRALDEELRNVFGNERNKWTSHWIAKRIAPRLVHLHQRLNRNPGTEPTEWR